MSEMETYRGKLVPVDLGTLSLDEWIQQELELKGQALPYGFLSWTEVLSELRYGSYLYHGATKTLYQVERESLDPSGFIESKRLEDGSYEFFVSYYNGGAGFDEVMATAIRRAD